MTDGREIRARRVISDAGVMNTFGRLLPPLLVEKCHLGPKLRQIERSGAYVCLTVGLQHTDKELRLGPSNLWIFPNCHHEQNLKIYEEL